MTTSTGIARRRANTTVTTPRAAITAAATTITKTSLPVAGNAGH
jgi:hypothetical protein